MTPTEGYRLEVVEHALRLFAEQGYESTTVDEIAEAAGISRRTFFRQFRSKDDVVFADHEALLARVAEFLAGAHTDPPMAVVEAAMIVFARFAQVREFAHRRYEVIREIPALRDREIIQGYRYERMFLDYLRGRLPDADDLTLAQYVAAVIATHNYLLRRMVRGVGDIDATTAKAALVDVRDMLNRAKV
jgi:AcrR family transcriptional regulator